MNVAQPSPHDMAVLRMGESAAPFLPALRARRMTRGERKKL